MLSGFCQAVWRVKTAPKRNDGRWWVKPTGHATFAEARAHESEPDERRDELIPSADDRPRCIVIQGDRMRAGRKNPNDPLSQGCVQDRARRGQSPRHRPHPKGQTLSENEGPFVALRGQCHLNSARRHAGRHRRNESIEGAVPVPHTESRGNGTVFRAQRHHVRRAWRVNPVRPRYPLHPIRDRAPAWPRASLETHRSSIPSFGLARRGRAGQPRRLGPQHRHHAAANMTRHRVARTVAVNLPLSATFGGLKRLTYASKAKAALQLRAATPSALKLPAIACIDRGNAYISQLQARRFGDAIGRAQCPTREGITRETLLSNWLLPRLRSAGSRDGDVASALPFRAIFHANQPPVGCVKPTSHAPFAEARAHQGERAGHRARAHPTSDEGGRSGSL
jgi:hypothetical protein